MLAPIVVAGAVVVARALVIRAGRFSLAAEKAAGGHTIARHVGKTEAELRVRLASQAAIPAASSFRTLAEAERVVSEGLRANSVAIQNWARQAAAGQSFRVL